MANQGLEDFYAKVMADQALQSQLTGAPDVQSFVAMAVRLGQEHGYTFTADEVVARLGKQDSNVELSDKELEAVAGGYVSFGSSLLCGYCGKTSGTCSLTSAIKQ